jgi:hypothetical protein
MYVISAVAAVSIFENSKMCALLGKHDAQANAQKIFPRL